MAYRFQVNQLTCINCGICMDLCPVRCLDMTRPSGEGERAQAEELLTPIPGDTAAQSWMMLSPVQVAQCIGCQVCAQECPTNAITIASSEKELTYAKHGPLSSLPPEQGWQPLDAYTRAFPEEPGESPWGEGRAWHVAERQTTWQSWRSWLGEGKEDLRAPCQSACPVGTNAGLYVSLIAEGRYDEALQVASEPNPFPCICGRVCTAPCEDVCRRGEFDLPIAIRDLKRFAMDHGAPRTRKVIPPRQWYEERVAIVGAGPTGLSAAYYLARRGYRVTVYDAMPVAGGMMSIGIPDYRLPRAELHRDIDAMRELGVEIILDTAVGRDITLYELQEQFDAVLLAVGAQRSQRLAISEPDEKGRRKPVPILGTEFDLPVDIVLVAIGEAPDPSFLPEGTSVGVAPWGGLLINPQTLATAAPGVFAAGDITYGPKSIIHAAAHGRLAARSIHAYLSRRPPREVSEMPDDEFQTASTLPPGESITLDLRPTKREVMALRGSEASRDRSIEFVTGFTEEQARREASRCLRCDLAYLCPTVHVISADSVVSARTSR